MAPRSFFSSAFAGFTNARRALLPERASRTARRSVLFAAALPVLAALSVFAGPNPAAARCIPVADNAPGPQWSFAGTASGVSPRVLRTAAAGTVTRGPKLPADTVELTFLGHSSFLIRTAQDATAITDYNGYIRAPFAPDIVTMNHAHTTHYTEVIEPGVKYVLKGWMENGKIPSHNVTVRDLHVTNVPTNIRESVGDSGWAGNSIFIFKSASICIVHLGHLHHRLIPSHAAKVGMVDVLLAPIDDSYTMPQSLLVQVIDDLKPNVVVPMHYGFGGTLEKFLATMKSRKFDIRIATTRTTRFTKASLPRRPTVLVLQGGGI
jgi:L-ascorbate metabolism protein UlaG (beta-lactamase superfamily)